MRRYALMLLMPAADMLMLFADTAITPLYAALLITPRYCRLRFYALMLSLADLRPLMPLHMPCHMRHAIDYFCRCRLRATPICYADA